MSNSICSIIVTYNRKALLLESLDAIMRQSKPVQGIFIIDNNSQDETAYALKDAGFISRLSPVSDKVIKSFTLYNTLKNKYNGKDIKIYYVRMAKNTGGAGGFYEGIKRAYEEGYEWFWLMDDDTIAEEDALQSLIKANNTLKNEEKVGFVCSKALWTDGTPHKMNIPEVHQLISLKKVPFNKYENKDILLVDSASFVSLLVNREVVKAVGLPLKEFFIWGDDVEYTYRITQKGYVGVYAKNSRVIHKTKTNYTSSDCKVDPLRHYYDMRNRLYIFKKRKYAKFVEHFIYQLFTTFSVDSSIRWSHLKGTLAGLFFNPKIEYPESVSG